MMIRSEQKFISDTGTVLSHLEESAKALGIDNIVNNTMGMLPMSPLIQKAVAGQLPATP
jgi:hypothetical protein